MIRSTAEGARKGASPAKPAKAPASASLLAEIVQWLDDAKAENVISIPLEGKSSLGDYMVVASGRNDRHVGAIAELLAGWPGGALVASHDRDLLEQVDRIVQLSPLGIFVAMIFIGFPFVVRTVQPVLIDLEIEVEEAAASLGASRWDIIRRVILPSLTPAILTGFALAFARAVGEYGSVIFIAGNLPNVSEIAPLLIVIRLSEFRYADATAIAVIMLVVSFLVIFTINRIQRWAQTRGVAVQV